MTQLSNLVVNTITVDGDARDSVPATELIIPDHSGQWCSVAQFQLQHQNRVSIVYMYNGQDSFLMLFFLLVCLFVRFVIVTPLAIHPVVILG